MKKAYIYTVIFTLIFAMVLSACGSRTGKATENANSSTEESSKATENVSDTSAAETDKDLSASTSKKQTDDTDSTGGAVITARYYRLVYYCVPFAFVNIVGKDEFNKWEDTYLSNLTFINNDAEKPSTIEIVEFIKYFNISREDFDRANLNYAKAIDDGDEYRPLMNPLDFAEQESDEIYNADIIFTLDYDTINSYYKGLDNAYPFMNRYEYNEAVAAGEYTPRTTDYIDVDQMEKDIIAKYGK